jgi:hypothetical protein
VVIVLARGDAAGPLRFLEGSIGGEAMANDGRGISVILALSGAGWVSHPEQDMP